MSLVKRLKEGGPEPYFMMYVHIFPSFLLLGLGLHVLLVCEPFIAALCYHSFPGMVSSGRGIGLAWPMITPTANRHLCIGEA